MPILLHDTGAFDTIMTVLESQVSSIRHLDAASANQLKQLIDRLKVWLSLLVDLRAELEALIERAASELRAERNLSLKKNGSVSRLRKVGTQNFLRLLSK